MYRSTGPEKTPRFIARALVGAVSFTGLAVGLAIYDWPAAEVDFGSVLRAILGAPALMAVIMAVLLPPARNRRAVGWALIGNLLLMLGGPRPDNLQRTAVHELILLAAICLLVATILWRRDLGTTLFGWFPKRADSGASKG